MSKSYSEKLQHPKWQKKRLEILKRDKFTCTLCNDKETTLHIHHTKYSGEPWEIPNENLKTVCSHCHEVLHELKEYNILKLLKRPFNFGECIGLYAYSSHSVYFLAKMEGSPVQLVASVSYDSLDSIYKNKPKIKK